MIRPATIDDASAIAEVHVNAWKKAYAGIVPSDYLERMSVEKRTEWWRKALGERQGTVLVAVVRDKVVGWISFGPSGGGEADTVEIYAIYILPDDWRRGIGSDLLKAAEPSLGGFSSTVLWVLAENKRALAFYRDRGFEPDGATKQIEIGGAHLREIRLRRVRP